MPPPDDPATVAGYSDHPARLGFFTDTSVCIGCKACEVACKEWNEVPEDGLNWTGHSHDNTGGLSGSTWRHVAFVEQQVPASGHEPNFQRDADDFRAWSVPARYLDWDRPITQADLDRLKGDARNRSSAVVIAFPSDGNAA